MHNDWPVSQPRVDVLGVGIHAIDMENAVLESERLLASGGHGYVCVTGVHGVMEAQADPVLRAILNRAFLCVPDGMPTVWVGRLRGQRRMRRVYGPDYMMEMCRRSRWGGYRHFLLGGAPGVVERLQTRLIRQMPWLQIVGTYTPPFAPLSAEQQRELAIAVAAVKPDILWVGLSTPKQERFMAEYSGRLDVKLMVGVGAAFDLHAGLRRDAPSWIKRCGLQWLHRLAQEPRRLGPRYLQHNPRFVWKICRQLASGSTAP
ncbi:MAG TPA: WecB/TagA/CpsF family glycosyltransferase [Candidatus Angelobacter sp.]|nr:WecB/TagA/CpsF family glycosyltransferase [Candidatus Angelobacter sp.]